jgi:hypothetical protein
LIEWSRLPEARIFLGLNATVKTAPECPLKVVKALTGGVGEVCAKATIQIAAIAIIPVENIILV